MESMHYLHAGGQRHPAGNENTVARWPSLDIPEGRGLKKKKDEGGASGRERETGQKKENENGCHFIGTKGSALSIIGAMPVAKLTFPIAAPSAPARPGTRFPRGVL